MTIIKTIIIYILAIVIVGNFGTVAISLPAMHFLRPLIAKIKWFHLIAFALLDAIGNFIAVFIVSLLCKLLLIAPNSLMIIIPLVYTIIEDNKRIERAKAGKSSAKRLFEQENELEEYDQKQDVRIEYAHLIGDTMGLLLGLFYFFF